MSFLQELQFYHARNSFKGTGIYLQVTSRGVDQKPLTWKDEIATIHLREIDTLN